MPRIHPHHAISNIKGKPPPPATPPPIPLAATHAAIALALLTAAMPAPARTFVTLFGIVDANVQYLTADDRGSISRLQNGLLSSEHCGRGHVITRSATPIQTAKTSIGPDAATTPQGRARPAVGNR